MRLKYSTMKNVIEYNKSFQDIKLLIDNKLSVNSIIKKIK